MVLQGLSPTAFEAFSQAARLYDSYAAAVERSGVDTSSVDEFAALADRLEVPVREMNRRIATDDSTNEVVRAREIDAELYARMARKILLSLCRRYFRWGATDLMRLRISAAAGYIRLQAEAMEMIVLFNERLDLANRWLSPKEDREKLFRKISKVMGKRKLLERLDLKLAYKHGSAVAMHPGMETASRAARFLATANGVSVDVLDQEFDPEDPFSYHLVVAYFLRTQQRILEHLPDVFTELAEHADGCAEFRQGVDNIWWVLERKYPERVRASEQIAFGG